MRVDPGSGGRGDGEWREGYVENTGVSNRHLLILNHILTFLNLHIRRDVSRFKRIIAFL